MHRRFAGATTSELSCPGGTVRVVVAESFRLRLLGLMGLGTGEIVPLLLPRCRSIHTRAMRASIDLVWLSLGRERARVLAVAESLGPGRHRRFGGTGAPKRTIAALELSPGEAHRLGLRPGADVGLG
jgi:uncharacterized membrane protein (UPF0127 family)